MEVRQIIFCGEPPPIKPVHVGELLVGDTEPQRRRGLLHGSLFSASPWLRVSPEQFSHVANDESVATSSATGISTPMNNAVGCASACGHD